MTATWTLSTIRTYARDRSGFGTSQISDGAIDVIINRVYRSLVPLEAAGMPIEGFSTITTVAGVGVYDIDEEILNVATPITLDDGDGDLVVKLDFFRAIDKERFFRLYPEDDSVDDNQPASVLLYGNANSTGSDKDNQLYVRPIPDAVYTIKFASTTRPQLLSSDSDPPVDDDMGYYIGVRVAIDMIDTIAGGTGERKEDLRRDLKDFEGNLNIKDIKQMTGTRSKPRF